jgi:hypothetical protein
LIDQSHVLCVLCMMCAVPAWFGAHEHCLLPCTLKQPQHAILERSAQRADAQMHTLGADILPTLVGLLHQGRACGVLVLRQRLCPVLP